MEAKLNELKERLREVGDYYAISSLMGWDQATYMPPGGAEARGRQMARIGKLAHEKATDPAIGTLLDELQPYADSLPYDSDDAGLIRATRRAYERDVRVPPALVAEMSEHGARSYQAWISARPQNDFAALRPLLEKTLELSRKVADCFPGYTHIADPLIDMFDYGMKAQSVRALFAQLRQQLVPLVKAITAQPVADDSCLKRHFPKAGQLAFGEEIIKRYGYDFERGRQDLTHHPFATKFAIGDVRITTRVQEHDLGDCLFSTLHESGHAMYEQGVDPLYEGTTLDGGTSAGVHESQSRLWENIVGRSLAFWEHYYPRLQAMFPDTLNDVPLETFYRAINKVQRSLIRVDADEVTYNLHVMIRFDLELALLEGTLEVRDLAEAWHARYEQDLGIRAPDDRDGVLQDVHWYSGRIGGMFQGYTLGNILSAQFYEAALKAHPHIPTEIGRGEFGTLHGWLRENIYRHGSKYTAPELIERASGSPMSIEPYMRYLRGKYEQLYKV
ncbi:MAG: carboxypeptidase M32 [Chloroflexi bacterium]|nr:carboxypeptidase M32 [Chloroflexota bacterium]